LNNNGPVHIIPNGYKNTLFNPNNTDENLKSLQMQSDMKMILSVGSLLEVKGYTFLIKAVSEYIKYKKDIMCIIIGVGPLNNKLHKQIKKLELEDHIKLLGGKPHNEIPHWMNACDIFTIPSLNEGNPTVMFEALGCGKPVIATRVGGIPEIITSDDYGLLVNPGDSKDLSEKLLFALEKKWDYKKILEYSKLYSWDNIIKKILEVYAKTLTE
jgi:glycosyltransferase involved in cell wall biosynthesis